MNIGQDKRRVRIQGALDDVRGYAITVYDIETGQAIENVFSIIIMLDVNKLNQAKLQYYVCNDDNSFVAGEDLQPVIGSVVTVDPEIDVTCIEMEGQTEWG